MRVPRCRYLSYFIFNTSHYEDIGHNIVDGHAAKISKRHSYMLIARYYYVITTQHNKLAAFSFSSRLAVIICYELPPDTASICYYALTNNTYSC